MMLRLQDIAMSDAINTRILDFIQCAREFYKDFLIKVFTKKQKYNTLKFDFLTYAIANVEYVIVV